MCFVIAGVMQRLIQKEKEVTRLSGEIDRLKIQLLGDAHEQVGVESFCIAEEGTVVIVSESLG